MVLLYNFFIQLFRLGISIASFFNSKAGLWLHGRANWRIKLKTDFSQNTAKVVWVHCASLGEFEQGRPIIEKLKKDYPKYKILLTFFSPSGYEIRKNYKNADWVYYLPLDTAQNAAYFIETCKPSLCIIIKYEYWYHFLHQLNKKQIPVFLVSAIFRKNAIFFKWYGGLHRKMLRFFSYLFVQNEESSHLLKDIVEEQKIIVAGDTRFDTVAGNALNFQPIEIIEQFKNNASKTIVAGSTWPDDEIILSSFSLKNPAYKIIIAPHEIGNEHILQLQKLFKNAILYTDFFKNYSNQNILIINTIGILSKIYKYADICYIGGGFNKSGIHNTLEAAVFDKPIITGSNIYKFNEAKEMNLQGGLITIDSEVTFSNAIIKLENEYPNNKISNLQYVQNKMGATEMVFKYFNIIFQ